MATQKSSKPTHKGPQPPKTSVKKTDSWNSPYVYWAIFVIVLIFLGGLTYWYFNKEGSLLPEEKAQDLTSLPLPVDPEMPSLSHFNLPSPTPQEAGGLPNEPFAGSKGMLSAGADEQEALEPGYPLNEKIDYPPPEERAPPAARTSQARGLSEPLSYEANMPQPAPVLIQPQGPSEMEKLIMQRVVLDDMLRKVEEGGPFILDLDIMHKWLKDPEPRAALLAIEPYAHNGIGSSAPLLTEARVILAQNQEEKASEADSAVSRFLKSIIRVSKKSNNVSLLEKALQDKEFHRALSLADELIKEGYPLKSWLDKLKIYVRSKEEIEKACTIIHSYIRRKLLEIADKA